MIFSIIISWSLLALHVFILAMLGDIFSILTAGLILLFVVMVASAVNLVLGLKKINDSKKRGTPSARWVTLTAVGVLPCFLALFFLLSPFAARDIFEGPRQLFGRFFERAVTVTGYHPVGDFSEGLAAILSDAGYGNYGYLDASGKIGIKVQCDFADSFSQGRAVIARFDRQLKKYQFGYIDRSGNTVIEPKFDDTQKFSGGLAAVKSGGRYGYINLGGEMVIAPQFDRAFSFSQDRAKVVVNGRAGFIDSAGKLIVSPQYYRAEAFSEGLAAVCDASQCGYLDRSGAVAIALKFDDALPFAQGFAPVKTGKKWRYIDHKGALLASEDFDSAQPFSDGLGLVSAVKSDFFDKNFGGYSGTRHAFGFIDRSGRYVITPKLLGAGSFACGLAPVAIPAGDFFGEVEDYVFIDKNGKRITGRFRLARPFKEGFAFVKRGDDTGFINSKGSLAIRFKTRTPYFSERNPPPGMRYGFINGRGESVIPAGYHSAAQFSDGLARVDKGLKRQFINQQGEVVFEVSSASLPEDFSEGLAAIAVRDAKTGKLLYGYMNKTGQIVIKPQFYAAGAFRHGLAAVKFSSDYNHKGWGYIDSSGKTVIPPAYRGAAPFYRERAFVEYVKELKYGAGEIHYAFIDPSGKTVIDFAGGEFIPYDSGGNLQLDPKFFSSSKGQRSEAFYSFVAETIPVLSPKAAGKIGYIDRAGQLTIEPRFDDGRPFSQGLAAVKIGALWGYIDRSGKVVIPPAFDSAGDFNEDRAKVEIGGKYGYIDPRGAWIVKAQFFEEAYPFSQGRALIKMNGQYGFIDRSGNFVIDPQFDSARPFQEDLAMIAYAN